ncbi:hypothetical protein D9M73_269200 [compost metagenome]
MDTAAGSVAQVHSVGADAADGDDLEGGQLVHQRIGQALGTTGDYATNARTGFGEQLLRVGMLIQAVHLIGTDQLGIDGLWYGLGQQHFDGVVVHRGHPAVRRHDSMLGRHLIQV